MARGSWPTRFKAWRLGTHVMLREHGRDTKLDAAQGRQLLVEFLAMPAWSESHYRYADVRKRTKERDKVSEYALKDATLIGGLIELSTPITRKKKAESGMRVFSTFARNLENLPPLPRSARGWKLLDGAFCRFYALCAEAIERSDDPRRAVMDLLKRPHAAASTLRSGDPANANNATTFAPKIGVPRLPATDSAIHGRDAELIRLDQAWTDPRTNILTIAGDGGLGKTALVAQWRRDMASANFRGASHVIEWSFYAPEGDAANTSSDLFISETLLAIAGEPSDPSPLARAERLADLLATERVLLILDGLEVLQTPPGDHGGQVLDKALALLLKKLALVNRGLCVITTRTKIRDIAEFAGSTAPLLELPPLHESDGAKLLELLGVRGSRGELETASKKYGGHPLALNLLGTYIRDILEGDLTRATAARLFDQPSTRRAERIIEAYAKWFHGKAELEVMRALSFFDHSTTEELLRALAAAPRVEGLNDALADMPWDRLRAVLSRLRAARLVSPIDPTRPNIVETHPLVRAYFAKQTRDTALPVWREGHSRIFDHLQRSAEHRPSGIRGLSPLYAALVHGCEAGRYREAYWDVFTERIQRRDEFYGARTLGVFGAELSALSAFFGASWREPVADLDPEARAFLLSEAGFCLRATGRLADAALCMETGAREHVQAEEWYDAARAAGNAAETLLALGDIRNAEAQARNAIDFARRSGDDTILAIRLATLADILAQAGSAPAASKLFEEAEQCDPRVKAGAAFLPGYQGYLYFDHLLDHHPAEQLAQRAAFLATHQGPGSSTLSRALGALAQARIALTTLTTADTNEQTRIAQTTDHSVRLIRETGYLDELPRALLTRAEYRRRIRATKLANTDIEEALTTSRWSGLRLMETDALLERAALRHETKDAGAQHDIRAAHQIINETNYERRRPALHATNKKSA